MTMKATTVRFSEDLWEALDRESRRDGVSAAQFVRDATLLRIGGLATRRGDQGLYTSVQEMATQARRRAHPEIINDPQRLHALRNTHLLDTAAEERFDRLTSLVRRVLAVPVALISLLDSDRQFFKSQDGLPEPWCSRRQTPLSHSFCQYVVTSGEPLVVNDSRQHPILRDNPAVEELGVIAYLGAPLFAPDGQPLGSLCAIDHQPRFWTDDQIHLLTDLAQLATTEITLSTNRAHSDS